MCIFNFQNNVLPSGDKFVDGNSVVIQEVSRHHSGIYICSADNEVGNPARAEIDLKVLCKFSYLLKDLACCKGQAKSKWFFASWCFFQKTNKWIQLYCYDTAGRLIFVRFLEEIEDNKKTFPIQLTFSIDFFYLSKLSKIVSSTLVFIKQSLTTKWVLGLVGIP